MQTFEEYWEGFEKGINLKADCEAVWDAAVQAAREQLYAASALELMKCDEAWQKKLDALIAASPCGQKFADGTPHPKFLWRFKYEGTPQGDPGAEDQWHCLVCASEAKLREEIAEDDKTELELSKTIVALENELTALREGLQELFYFIDSGVLVRDISHDGDPDWAIKQLPLVACLRQLQSLLTPPAASGRESEAKDNK